MTSQLSNQTGTAILIAGLVLLSASNCTAQSATYNDSYSLQGFSQPFRVSEVAGTTTGTVEKLCAREGETVHLGQSLIELDRSVHEAKLELARVAMESLGELDTANAELKANSTRLKRIQELASRQHATQTELLQAEEMVAISRASVVRAQDRLAQQRADYARLVAESKRFSITAPFDGIILEFAKQKGEFVGPGDSTVCTVVDLSKLVVEFVVPGHYRHNLKLNTSVDVLFTGTNQNTSGTIRYISPFPNGETNTYTVKVDVENFEGRFNAGERCQLNGLNSAQASNNEVSNIAARTQVTARD